MLIEDSVKHDVMVLGRRDQCCGVQRVLKPVPDSHLTKIKVAGCLGQH